MQNLINKGAQAPSLSINNSHPSLHTTRASVLSQSPGSSSNVTSVETISNITERVLVEVITKSHEDIKFNDPGRQEQLDAIKKHQGHENQHLAMVLILCLVMTVSQILLVWWKNKYQKSYIHCSMFAMYILPLCISAHKHWWRFVSIWMFVSIITIVLVWRPLFMPNFAGSGSTIPRLLYKWFFTVYAISSLIAVAGYFVNVLTFFGINLLLNISPQTALDIGIMMLFYGTYYGVLCRDFTDFLVDKLAAQIGYYNPNSALPSKSLRADICAICGVGHGDKEDIDIEGLTKNDTLLEHSNYLSDDFHPEQETLIEFSNEKERLFVLTCGHKFHEYCIYGWCLVGKRQVCPFCREKVDLGRMFSALPFQKPHMLYGNFLEFIRYLFAW